LIENYYRWDEILSNVSKGDKVFRENIQIGDCIDLYKLFYIFPFAHVVNPGVKIKYCQCEKSELYLKQQK